MRKKFLCQKICIRKIQQQNLNGIFSSSSVCRINAGQLCLLADRSDWARQQGDLAARLLQGTET
jgi:hypothetical protein